jgi:hypothetical protein
MMRVYSSLLMSSLLLSATAVNAQSLETRSSTFFAQGNPGPEILTALAHTQSLYADHEKEQDTDAAPERGSGRGGEKLKISIH